MRYIGVKIINAEPAQANEEDKRGKYPIGADGYKVTYEDGYTSWSPKEVFDAAYRPTDGLTFGLAIEALKLGNKVARAGWASKKDNLEMMPYSVGAEIAYGIGIRINGDMLWRWGIDVSDVMADDWQIIE